MIAPQTRPITGLAEITGLWRRSLMRRPDGRTDPTTAERWMQTPSLFADLRQPANRPSFRANDASRPFDRRRCTMFTHRGGRLTRTPWSRFGAAGQGDHMQEEAEIIINGTRLSDSESMTIRVAVDTLANVLAEDLGEGEGKILADRYMSALGSIQSLLESRQSRTQ
jgi:hypothetical protein